MITGEEQIKQLASLILEERNKKQSENRYRKMEKVLLLLGKGIALSSVILMPGTAKLLKTAHIDSEWKEFNQAYLKRTIKALERKKMVEVFTKNGVSQVNITEAGKTKVLKFGLDSLIVSKPTRWDGRFRMVFYDVYSTKRAIRDKLRRSLLNAGFYKLQESVYLHAYPCEKEIEFLRNFLGISGEVRIVLAERIENDEEFRKFFGV